MCYKLPLLLVAALTYRKARAFLFSSIFNSSSFNLDHVFAFVLERLTCVLGKGLTSCGFQRAPRAFSSSSEGDLSASR